MARAAVIPKSSPPKRATRTTAKRTATTSTTTTTTSRTTKSAPGKSATRTTTKGKAPTSATEARKRGVRTATAASKQADESSDDGTDDELGDIDTKPRSSTTRTKAKSSASTTSTTGRGRRQAATATPEVESDEDEDELAQTEVPKKRAGRPKAKAVEPAAEPAAKPKTRGRPKGSGNSKTSATASTAAKESTQRKTRTQTSVEPDPEVEQAPREIVITTASSSMRSNILRGPAKKKKVTFRDPDSEEDMSEPIPPPAGRRRAATPSKKTGLGAKPVRSSPAASGRGRKPAAAKKGTSKPLSPKKATQVAKSISSYASSDGEDDELSAAKSPVRITVDSPTKHGSTKTGLSSPVKRINFASSSPHKKVDENGEPTAHFPMPMDFSESLFMSSPARRPTPSPFNFTMRETPRRGGFTLGESMKPLSQPDSTPTKTSPLKASPRKANLETPKRGHLGFLDESRPLSQPNFTPGHVSPLKSSPKKGLFSISLPSQPAPPVSSTPLKSMSLLQSPAKKVASPFKSSLLKKSPLAEDHESGDEDLEESYTPTQSPPKPVNFDDMDDDMESEGDEHVDAPTSEDPEGSFPAEREVQAQPETDSYAEQAEVYESSDDELGEQSQEHASNQMDDHYSEAPDNVPEDPMDPSELQAPEPASEQNFEGDNVNFEAEDNLEDDVEQEIESHSKSHSENTHTDFENHEKRESFRNSNIENAENENVQIMEEQVQDAEEDDDHVSELNYGEAERVVEPEQVQDEQTENSPEHSVLREVPTSAGRHSLTEGLEDVFVDAPLATGQTNEEPEPMSGDDMSEVDGEEDSLAAPNNQYDEELYDVGDDYAFDDDDETLVALEMTGQQQIFNAPDIENEQPQITAPRESEDQRSQSPVQPMEHVQSPVHDEEIGLQESSSCEVENRPSSPSLRNVESYRDESRDETDSNADDMSDSEPVAEGRTQANKNASPQVESQPENQFPAPATEVSRGSRPRFTLLADQLSGWKASSPEKPEPRRSKRRGVFSLGGRLRRSSVASRASRLSGQVSYPDIAAHEDHETPESSRPENNLEAQDTEALDDLTQEPETIQDNAQEVQPSIEQPNFEIFSDPDPEVVPTESFGETDSRDPVPDPSNEDRASMKPAPPVQEASFEDDDDKENDNIPLPGPVTPMKTKKNQLQTFHTVSKVPLKGEGQISPLKASRKRGLSLSGTSPSRSSSRIRKSLGPLEPASLRPPPKLPRLQQDTIPKLQPNMARRRSSMGQQPRSAAKPSRTSSPAKSRRKSLNAASLVLQGAVVFVDVHTTEGEDASGIFIELLQQMGARCVSKWSWNPRASVMPDEDTQTKEGRVGITHVVYKDGGVRTLEKVRHARGLVKCVGVGWVLDCEREGKWIDEAHYAVDSSIIPRGGAKRRKSMEPRALSNVNGTLVTSTAATNSRRSGADWTTVEDFKRHTPTPPLEEPSTPTNNRTYDASDAGGINERYFQTPKTPGYGFNIDNIGMSPATPHYLSQRNKLVQQTCPPKQLQQGLFSRAGPAEEPSLKLRAKLEAARRKSLVYKPRVGSPLIE